MQSVQNFYPHLLSRRLSLPHQQRPREMSLLQLTIRCTHTFVVVESISIAIFPSVVGYFIDMIGFQTRDHPSQPVSYQKRLLQNWQWKRSLNMHKFTAKLREEVKLLSNKAKDKTMLPKCAKLEVEIRYCGKLVEW